MWLAGEAGEVNSAECCCCCSSSLLLACCGLCVAHLFRRVAVESTNRLGQHVQAGDEHARHGAAAQPRPRDLH